MATIKKNDNGVGNMSPGPNMAFKSKKLKKQRKGKPKFKLVTTPKGTRKMVPVDPIPQIWAQLHPKSKIDHEAKFQARQKEELESMVPKKLKKEKKVLWAPMTDKKLAENKKKARISELLQTPLKSEKPKVKKGSYSMGGGGLTMSLTEKGEKLVKALGGRSFYFKKKKNTSCASCGTKVDMSLSGAKPIGSEHSNAVYCSGKCAEKGEAKVKKESPGHFIVKSETLSKAFEDRWLLELGDEMRKLTAAHQMPFEFINRPEGTQRNYIFKVGDCEVIYSIMGKAAQMHLKHPEKPNDNQFAIAKHFYYKLQQAHQPLTKSDHKDYIKDQKDFMGPDIGLRRHFKNAPHKTHDMVEHSVDYSHEVSPVDVHKWVTRAHKKGHKTHMTEHHSDTHAQSFTHFSSWKPKGEIKKTELGEELIKRLYGQQYASPWQEGLGAQQNRRRKQVQRRKERGKGYRKPVKSIQQRRLQETSRRVMGGMEERRNVGKSLDAVIKAFGLAPQRSGLKHTSGVSQRGRVNIAARAGAGIKAPTMKSKLKKIKTAPAVSPKSPTPPKPSIDTPKMGKTKKKS